MRVAVIVPTYNEAQNLPRLAEQLAALDLDVICVDDSSPDGTGEIADQLAAMSRRFHVIHRAMARGYAGSCRDGLQAALDMGFDVIGTMDADLSHDPASIGRLIEAIAAGADVAIGSRYVAGGQLVVDWGPLRRAVSQAGSRYARMMLGVSVHDCTSGFRFYRSAVLRAVPFGATKSEGYSFLIEMLSLLGAAGADISEVPITYVDRRAGASKISRSIILEALYLTTVLGVRRALRT